MLYQKYWKFENVTYQISHEIYKIDIYLFFHHDSGISMVCAVSFRHNGQWKDEKGFILTLQSWSNNRIQLSSYVMLERFGHRIVSRSISSQKLDVKLRGHDEQPNQSSST